MSKARDLADSVSTGGILEDGAVSVSEISDLTVTAEELNNVAGVNSDVQTQLDLKAPLASPTFTGDATFDTDTLAVDSTNNRVGIGTTTPVATLEVDGTTTLTGGGTGAIHVNIEDSSLCPTMTFTRNGGGTVTNGFMKFENSGGQVAEINATGGGYFLGNVGVGTSSPSSFASTTLEISGSSTTSDLKLTNTTTGTGNSAGFDLELNGSDINYVNRTASGNQKFWTNSTERFRFGSSGELGIGGATYGTAGQVLTSGGSGAAPTWADAAGGGTVELTAAENLSAGQSVVVNSSGQAAGVSQTVGSVVFEEQLQQSGGDIRYFDMVYFPNANYNGSASGSNDGVIACFYKRTSDGYTKEKRYNVNSLTGVIVSQGDQTLLGNANDGYGLACAYSSGVDKGMLVNANVSSNDINCRGFDYNGTTYVGHNSITISSHNYQSDQRIALVYDESLDFFLMSADKQSSILPIYVLTLNNLGTPTNPSSSTVNTTGWDSNYKFPVMATDGNGQFVMLAYDASGGTCQAVAFTVTSGYSFTYGSKVQVSNSSQFNDSMSIEYDKASGKFVTTAKSSSGIDIRSLTVSNNSISLGTATNVSSSNVANGLVDGGEGRMGLVYSTYSALYYKPVSVASNGNITLGTAVQVNDSSLNSGWDTSRNFKTISTKDSMTGFAAYVNFANYQYGDLYGSEFAQTISSDNEDFIGMTTSAITSGATGDITVIGGLNDQQSGLTAGTKYYVTGTGSLTTVDSGVYAGRALSSTNLLVKG